MCAEARTWQATGQDERSRASAVSEQAYAERAGGASSSGGSGSSVSSVSSISGASGASGVSGASGASGASSVNSPELYARQAAEAGRPGERSDDQLGDQLSERLGALELDAQRPDEPADARAVIPQPPSSTVQTSSEPPRTLWMGDLDPSFDEATIQRIWAHLGKCVSVKLIRAKKNLLIPCSTSSTFSDTQPQAPAPEGSGALRAPDADGAGRKIHINGVSFIDPNTTQLHHAGYCFVEFESLADAQWALTLNSTPLPDITCPGPAAADMASPAGSPAAGPDASSPLRTNPTGLRNFRLNWASGATLLSAIPSTPEFSLFVGDLSPTATEAHLLSLFQKKFKSVKTVRVMTDPITGASRCFGFVRFGDEQERRRALVEMNGVWCQGRNLRVAYATPRNNVMWQLTQPQHQQRQPQHHQHQHQHHQQQQQQQQLHHQQLHQHQHQQQQLHQQHQQHQQHQHHHHIQNHHSQYHQHYQSMSQNNFQLASPEYTQAPLLMRTASSLVGNNLINFPATDFVSGSDAPYMGVPSMPPSLAHASAAASGAASAPAPGRSPFTNPNNTTVFIGGLTSHTSERQLHSLFAPFGTIINVKIPPGKGCGFVKYAYRIDAEAAIQGMQGFIVGGNPIRLSWGRTSTDTSRHPAMQDMPSSLRNVASQRGPQVWNSATASTPTTAVSMFASPHIQRQDSVTQAGSVPPVHPSLL